MNVKRLFVAVFRAVSCLNEEKSQPDMQQYLEDSDPYIFTDRTAAIQDVQITFENSNSILTIDDFNNYPQLYEAVYKYLSETTTFSSRFLEISKEEWSTLCTIVDNECDREETLP